MCGGGESLARVLKEAIAAEKTKGMFDDFSSVPMVIYSQRVIPVDFSEELVATWPAFHLDLTI